MTGRVSSKTIILAIMKIKALLLSLLALSFLTNCEKKSESDRKELLAVSQAIQTAVPGCDEGGIPGPQDFAGIIGGLPLSKESRLHKSIVMLMSFKKDGSFGTCTGTIVSENVILTAAHCVVDAKTQKKVDKVVVIFAVNPWCLGEEIVNRSILATKFDVQEMNDLKELERDVALVQIPHLPTGYFPMPVVTKSELPRQTQVIYVAGYGREDDDPDKQAKSGRLKTTQLPLIGAIPVKRDPRTNEVKSFFYVVDQPLGGICMGDSGGPAMMRVGGQLKMFAVASRVNGPDKSPCREKVAYAAVESNRRWLRETFDLYNLNPKVKNPFESEW